MRGSLWREKIKTSMLLNRLQDNALGTIELTSSQIKSIEILLRKTIPDLKAIEYSGVDGAPIQQDVTVRYVVGVMPIIDGDGENWMK